MKPGAVTNPAVLVEAHVDRVDTRAFGALAHERHRSAVVRALLGAADVYTGGTLSARTRRARFRGGPAGLFARRDEGAARGVITCIPTAGCVEVTGTGLLDSGDRKPVSWQRRFGAFCQYWDFLADGPRDVQTIHVGSVRVPVPSAADAGY
jgi:hypothetical protein